MGRLLVRAFGLILGYAAMSVALRLAIAIDPVGTQAPAEEAPEGAAP
jgi:hypothetical protein